MINLKKVLAVVFSIFILSTGSMSLFLNYNFNHSEISSFEENPQLEDKKLKFTPMHQLKTGIDWSNKWFDWHLAAIYKSKQYTTDDNSRYIDPYMTFDTKISRYMGEKLLFFASITDLLDNQHLDSEFYLSPGRTVTLGVSYKF